MKRKLNEDGMTTGDIAMFMTTAIPSNTPKLNHKKIMRIKLKHNPLNKKRRK